MQLIEKGRVTLICDRCHSRRGITKGEVCDNCRRSRKVVEIAPAGRDPLWTDEYRASVLAAAETVHRQRKYA